MQRNFTECRVVCAVKLSSQQSLGFAIVVHYLFFSTLHRLCCLEKEHGKSICSSVSRFSFFFLPCLFFFSHFVLQDHFTRGDPAGAGCFLSVWFACHCNSGAAHPSRGVRGRQASSSGLNLHGFASIAPSTCVGKRNACLDIWCTHIRRESGILSEANMHLLFPK